MSSNGTDSGDPAPRRLIYRAREQLQLARVNVWEEGVHGEYSVETKLTLATSVLTLWDMLFEYRDESVLDEGDFPDVSELRSRVGEQTTRRRESAGLGRGSVTETVPAVSEIPLGRLLTLSKELDDLCRKLGFSAEAQSKRPLYAAKRDPEEYQEPVKDGIPRPQ